MGMGRLRIMARSNSIGEEFQYWNNYTRLRFSRLSIREKALSILFIGALLAVWFTFQLDRHGLALRDMRSANQLAEQQGLWIVQEDVVEENYQAMIDSIDLDQLPTVDDVGASVDDLNRKFGLNYKTSRPKSIAGRPLTFHVFTIDLDDADYNKLIEFTNEIKTSLPYVSLQSVKLQANRRNGQLLTAKLELKSIEYTP